MENSELKTKKMSLANIEGKLSVTEMESIMAGSGDDRLWGCALSGLAAGIAAGVNPLVGGLVTASCFLLN